MYYGLSESQEQNLQILTEQGIKNVINSGKPFGVLYGAYNQYGDWSGHWVVGIGYASAPGHDLIVVSNDPWGGIQRIQSYNDFMVLPDGRSWCYTAK